MKRYNAIIDRVVLSKKEICKNLSIKEKNEVDIYFEELLEEFMPMLLAYEKISSKEDTRNDITSAIKDYVKEEKWLEKLSKTFYDQEDIQDLMKTQTE